LVTVSAGRIVIQATIDDALHYSESQREAIIASYPPWEQEARVKGIPSLGSGRVFPIAEDALRCEAFEVPRHFPQIIGVDFGYDHPFAASRCAWDRDDDIFYVVATYRESGASAPIHAAALRPWGLWIPIAWPHDGLQHDKGSGDQLAAQYRTHGLNMLGEHATHEEGGFGLEAGIQDMMERMLTGRWRVFPGNDSWFSEFRLYHRKAGQIVKERDDLISASRYALMMKRFADVRRAPSDRNARLAGGQHGWMG
jgi:Terminase RNaseH-like domain/Terminase large subunit, T4likevirus-type, N-terminal